MKRKAIRRDVLDVIALYHVMRGDGTPVLSRQETEGMESADIKELFRSRVQVEHMVPHALTANDHPSNLRFITPDDHKPKTAADVKAIAKSKRVARAEEEFRRRLLAKAGRDSIVAPVEIKPRAKLRTVTKTVSRLQGRGFQRSAIQQKIKSRPFSKRGKTNGTDEEERS
jgi:hypothetical protein